jgi:outer membrane protein OmpA-like peptidoglycan-associated protein
VAAAAQRVKGAPAISPADVLTLQRAVGNRAVRQSLARGARRMGDAAGLERGAPGPGGEGQLALETHSTPLRSAIQREDGEGTETGAAAELGEATPDVEQQALQEFLGRGMMPSEVGEDVIGAGGRGGFNAKFDPDQRELIATVNIGINFHHGLQIDPTSGVVTADPSGFGAGDATRLASMQTNAANIMNDFPDRADRADEVNTNWRWAEDEKDDWMERYRTAVMDVWNAQHYFQSTRWDELQANVRLVLNVHAGDQEGDHTSGRIIKSPPGTMGAYVARGSETNAQDQSLFMSGSGTGPSATNFLRYSLQFENNSAELETAVGTVHSRDAGPAYLTKFIADFEAADPSAGAPIQIIGRASSTGSREHNQRLSERRSANVEAYLRNNGLNGSIDRTTSVAEGAEGATEDESWRRVEIIVGTGEAQNTAAHEFGHMIGLGDEYSSPAAGFAPGAGTPVAVGDPAAHNALAQAMGGGVTGAVAENTDSIMSVGNTVRPQHYATFHKALEQVTGEDWEYGGASRGVELPAVGGPEPETAVA